MTREEAIYRLDNLRSVAVGKEDNAIDLAIEALSAEVVQIHNDGTLEVKVPNAQKVGRVLVMDTDSHIGGGLFYPDEAVQGDGRNNLKRYPNCQMRTSLGNCDAIGGFCTSINAPICDAFHKLSEAVHKPDYSYEADMVRRLREYEQGYRQAQAEDVTNGRLIDADALSEKLCETTIFIKDGEVFQRMINDAPTKSAEAVQGWIPCSERLPEVGEICLLTVHEYGWNCKDYTRVIIGEYSDNYADHILAWMPLPKPYEPKTERRG